MNFKQAEKQYQDLRDFYIEVIREGIKEYTGHKLSTMLGYKDVNTSWLVIKRGSIVKLRDVAKKIYELRGE
jgi:hypothetical protein